MKSALLVSLSLHIAVTLVLTSLVRINRVKFVPRDVYSVSLVTPAEASKPKPKVVQKPPPPVEKKVEPPPKEDPKDDFVPPPEKKETPKEKPKKEDKKTVPTTEIEKTALPDTMATEDEEPEVPPETGEIALDVEHFPFGYYIVTMKRKIAAFWRVPGAPRETLHCMVYFQVGRTGAIRSPAIENSSGNIVFDQAALRAVVSANPLPPLPDGFSDDYLGVHFSFTFRTPE